MISAIEAKRKSDSYYINNIRYERLVVNIMKLIKDKASNGKYSVPYQFDDDEPVDNIENINGLLQERGFVTKIDLKKPYGFGCNLSFKVIDISWRGDTK